MFTYTGIPAGPVASGSSFTIGMSLVFVSGGIIPNVAGFSLWMAQLSPVLGFPFAITIRDTTGGQFHLPHSVIFPQVLDPISRNIQWHTPRTLHRSGRSDGEAARYHRAHISSITLRSPSPQMLLPGNYTIGGTTSSVPNVGGRISVINDSSGNTFNVAASNFNIAVVPEPSSIALLCVGLVSSRRAGLSPPC